MKSAVSIKIFSKTLKKKEEEPKAEAAPEADEATTEPAAEEASSEETASE